MYVRAIDKFGEAVPLPRWLAGHRRMGYVRNYVTLKRCLAGWLAD